jgi:alkylation response protein AidB-like acyl-CoA dehydrogenase
MDLSPDTDAETFRVEVTDFLDRHWTSLPIEAKRSAEKIAAFRRQAIDAGYLYRGVPRRFGGGEQPADVVRAEIIRSAFARTRAPQEVPGVGTAMLVPTLLDCGAAWQHEQFIRPTIEGHITWAQGYSEPDSGSDLASVKTRGTLIDRFWHIDGQKLWTTFGDRCDYMFALVRTEPDMPKHDGLSYLLIDLKQPGVTIRPLRQMTGASNFSEVFLDDVRTPADWIVGKRGEGWRVSRTTLGHERASIGSADRTAATFSKLLALARDTERFGAPAIQDREIRQRLATIEGWIMAQHYTALNQFSLAAAKRDAGPSRLMNKLLATDIGHDIASIAQELIGEAALYAPGVPGDKNRGNQRWLDQIFGSLGVAIAGGTSNIQRNIIAERGLGLPRADDSD